MAFEFGGASVEATPPLDPKYTVNCISCAIPPASAVVYRDEYVQIVLRTDNQYWLGRCVIVPIRHLSPLQLYEPANAPVMERISRCLHVLNTTFTHLYGMSYPNIAQLGNLTTDDESGKITADMRWHHAHYHYIPRYEHAFTRYGIRFVDEQWTLALNLDKPTNKLKPLVLSPSQQQQLIHDIQYTVNRILIGGFSLAELAVEPQHAGANLRGRLSHNVHVTAERRAALWHALTRLESGATATAAADSKAPAGSYNYSPVVLMISELVCSYAASAQYLRGALVDTLSLPATKAMRALAVAAFGSESAYQTTSELDRTSKVDASGWNSGAADYFEMPLHMSGDDRDLTPAQVVAARRESIRLFHRYKAGWCSPHRRDGHAPPLREAIAQFTISDMINSGVVRYSPPAAHGPPPPAAVAAAAAAAAPAAAHHTPSAPLAPTANTGVTRFRAVVINPLQRAKRRNGRGGAGFIDSTLPAPQLPPARSDGKTTNSPVSTPLWYFTISVGVVRPVNGDRDETTNQWHNPRTAGIDRLSSIAPFADVKADGAPRPAPRAPLPFESDRSYARYLGKFESAHGRMQRLMQRAEGGGSGTPSRSGGSRRSRSRSKSRSRSPSRSNSRSPRTHDSSDTAADSGVDTDSKQIGTEFTVPICVHFNPRAVPETCFSETDGRDVPVVEVTCDTATNTLTVAVTRHESAKALVLGLGKPEISYAGADTRRRSWRVPQQQQQQSANPRGGTDCTPVTIHVPNLSECVPYICVDAATSFALNSWLWCTLDFDG